MIKSFFFDLDGTLVDTHRANYEAYRRALADMGVDLTYDEFKKSIGHQAKVFLPWFAPHLSDDQIEEVARKKKQYYKETAHLSMLNKGLIKFIAAIKSEHSIVLVTTAKKENAQTILAHHGIDDLFDDIITAEDVTLSKPSPDVYFEALRRTGVQANEAVAFEDSLPGIESAEKAGIAVIEVRDFQA